MSQPANHPKTAFEGVLSNSKRDSVPTLAEMYGVLGLVASLYLEDALGLVHDAVSHRRTNSECQRNAEMIFAAWELEISAAREALKEIMRV